MSAQPTGPDRPPLPLLLEHWADAAYVDREISSNEHDVLVATARRLADRQPTDPDRAEQPAFAHPAWCSQGPYCLPPRLCRDDSVDWSHASMDVVDGKDLHGDVFLVHMREISAEGVLRTDAAVVITADGSFTADQAQAFGQACLTAAGLLRAGLVGPDTDAPAAEQ